MRIKGGFGWDHRSSESKRNLNGWFGVACRQEIFGGNLLKEWPEARNYSIQLASINIIFKENPKQNALEYLALWRDLMGIASEMLEI